MKLIDLIIREYIAVTEYISKKYPIANDRIIVDSKIFYALLDSNLYIKRTDKLNIYRNLNFIICNSNGLTSVVYDKETKKATRKIIINYETYRTVKKLYETEFKL